MVIIKLYIKSLYPVIFVAAHPSVFRFLSTSDFPTFLLSALPTIHIQTPTPP